MEKGLIPNSTMNNSIELERLESGKYKLTIVADKEFLADKKTVYPVKVDPSITVEGYKIWDTVAYQNWNYSTQGDNPYTSPINYFGKSTANGAGKLFVNWNYIQNYAMINPDNITSAYFRVFADSSAGGTLNVHPITNQWAHQTVKYI